MSFFELPVETLAKEWVKSFEKSPILTTVLSVVIAVATATGGYYLDKNNNRGQTTV